MTPVAEGARELRIAEEAIRLDKLAQEVTPTGTAWDGRDVPVEWSVNLVRLARAYLALLEKKP